MIAKGIVIPKINARLTEEESSWISPPITSTFALVNYIPPTVFPELKREVRPLN